MSYQNEKIMRGIARSREINAQLTDLIEYAAKSGCYCQLSRNVQSGQQALGNLGRKGITAWAMMVWKADGTHKPSDEISGAFAETLCFEATFNGSIVAYFTQQCSGAESFVEVDYTDFGGLDIVSYSNDWVKDIIETGHAD